MDRVNKLTETYSAWLKERKVGHQYFAKSHFLNPFFIKKSEKVLFHSIVFVLHGNRFFICIILQLGTECNYPCWQDISISNHVNAMPLICTALTAVHRRFNCMKGSGPMKICTPW